MRLSVITCALTLQWLIDFAISNNCTYEYWRLSVKTLGVNGWETYISSLTLHDEEGTELTGMSDFYTNTGSNAFMEHLFDGNSVSEYKFPQSSLPQTGDFIQWQCSPACNVARIEVSQSVGGNNIPEWDVMFSPQDFNFSTKWSIVTSTSPASSTAPVTTDPCIFFNASATITEDNTTKTTFMFYVIVIFLPFCAVLFLGVLYPLVFKRTVISNVSPKDDVESSIKQSIEIPHPVLSAPSVVANVRYEAFLSHDWGVDGGNHVAVTHVAAQLAKTGMKNWFDDERMHGNIVAQMTSGIDKSNIFVIFITQRYMDKVNGHDERDNCKIEFQYAFNRLGPQKMVAVVMERESSGMRSSGVDWWEQLWGAISMLTWWMLWTMRRRWKSRLGDYAT